MKLIKALFVMNLLILLSGCAFTTDQVPLNYQLNTPAPKDVYRSKQHASLSVKNIIDHRDVDNPKLIINKENMYGETTSGGYAAEKPIADIITQALAKGLQQVGYKIVNNSNKYSLQGSVEDIQLKTIMGFVQGTLEMETHLNLSLINAANGKQLWQQDFIGRGKVEAAWPSEDKLRQTFDASLTDIIHQLQESQSFYSALNS